MELSTIERLVRMETMIEEMHHELMGNGQPGTIEKFNLRLGSLEGSRNKFRGAIWLLSALLGSLATYLKLKQ